MAVLLMGWHAADRFRCASTTPHHQTKPFQFKPKNVVLFLQSKKISSEIMCLALLPSSVFIYNQMGTIEQQSLETLATAALMAGKVQEAATSGEEPEVQDADLNAVHGGAMQTGDARERHTLVLHKRSIPFFHTFR